MTDKQAITVKDALNAMAFYLKEQPELAWSWHCNIAMTAVDAGAPHLEANKRTADFMRSAFGVDVTDFKEYKSIMQIYETLNAAPTPPNTTDHQELLKIHQIIMSIEECPPITDDDTYTVKGVKNMAYMINSMDKPPPNTVDKAAYDGAREDLAIWKKRALEAENKVKIYDQRIVDIGAIAMNPVKVKQPPNTITIQVDEYERLKKDAERYRAIREKISLGDLVGTDDIDEFNSNIDLLLFGDKTKKDGE